MNDPSRPEAGPPSRRAPAVAQRAVSSVLGVADRVFGSRWNPLHQSGTLVVLSWCVLGATGLFLFLFYRVAEPWGSVARIDAIRPLGLALGSWIRTLHRYSADLAVAATAVHALKVLLAGRHHGPRARAWVAGVLLLGATWACGWTGLVMMWDEQARRIAVEGARLLDLLPIFSEPISRLFSGASAVPRSFFFMNLFLHVALPLGLLGLLWIHLSRLARPRLLPPRGLLVGALGFLALAAALAPLPLDPRADLLAVPGPLPLDLFYAFWIPWASRVSPAAHLTTWVLATIAVLGIPWWWPPRREVDRQPSSVDEHRCTGCTQCWLDCPYEAIAMVPRNEESRLSDLVARVDPELCVACGICAGSCAPMGVGPPGRTGRDQLATVGRWIEETTPRRDQVVVLACSETSGRRPPLEGVLWLETGCSGSVHTSVVELLIRRGAGGVFLRTCPSRDCRNREGPVWLEERLFHDREAELQSRVDRRRVALCSAARGETGRVEREIRSFLSRVRALEAVEAEERVDLDLECDVPEARAS